MIMISANTMPEPITDTAKHQPQNVRSNTVPRASCAS